MITFNFETDFTISNQPTLTSWIENIIVFHEHEVGEINFIFCDDDYLHKLNVEFLKHDTLTDVISFDNTLGKLINGDIYISVERVEDNAKDFKVSFSDELHRVMIHGVLHYLGFTDKDPESKNRMTAEENIALLKLSNL